MITINARTKAVQGWDRNAPMARNHFGDATPGYVRGQIKPNYPVPAIPIEVSYFDWAVAVIEMNDPIYRWGVITLYPN